MDATSTFSQLDIEVKIFRITCIILILNGVAAVTLTHIYVPVSLLYVANYSRLIIPILLYYYSFRVQKYTVLHWVLLIFLAFTNVFAWLVSSYNLVAMYVSYFHYVIALLIVGKRMRIFFSCIFLALLEGHLIYRFYYPKDYYLLSLFDSSILKIVVIAILFISTAIAIHVFRNQYRKDRSELSRQKNELESQKQEIIAQSERINEQNAMLSSGVYQQAERIKSQRDQLIQYAHYNSHNVRGPLARILGLTQLMKNDMIAEGELEYILAKIVENAEELDKVIHHNNHLLEGTGIGPYSE